jgi:Fe2+ or Zn2+ uptake regulation protein
MDDIPVHKYQLPNGYTYAEIEVVIKGTCAKCKNQEIN